MGKPRLPMTSVEEEPPGRGGAGLRQEVMLDGSGIHKKIVLEQAHFFTPEEDQPEATTQTPAPEGPLIEVRAPGKVAPLEPDVEEQFVGQSCMPIFLAPSEIAAFRGQLLRTRRVGFPLARA